MAAACSGKKQASTVPQDESTVWISDSSLRLMDVRLSAPEEKIIQSFVYMSGKVVPLPNYRAMVTSDIEGKVNRIFVKEGDDVKQGEPLMSMKSIPLIDLQGEYMEAKSQADFMAVEYQRQQELRRNNIGALAEFQVTESKYKAARSKMIALASKLRLVGVNPDDLDNPETSHLSTEVIIRSPIDGYVFKLPVEVGTVATTDVLLADLINTQKLMADVYVYDNDLDDIHENQQVEIDFINHMYPSVHGTVTHISRAFDPETKAVTAHVAFEAPPGRLILPDMSVRCVLTRRESQVPGPTVPRGSILVEEDHDFIYLTYPSEKNGVMNLLHKERISLTAQNEREVQIRLHNQAKPGYLVVTNNVMIVENQRKKLNGMAN